MNTRICTQPTEICTERDLCIRLFHKVISHENHKFNREFNIEIDIFHKKI